MKRLYKEESQRVARLHEYAVLDTPPEIGFDRLVELACRFFSVPMAAVSLVDAQRQWLKASYGLPRRECPRGESFCARAIETDGVMVVTDAAEDPRFADHPMVIGPAQVRFYAGAPLRTKDGFRLGTLCIVDVEPRPFGAEEEATLADLAAMVVDELDLRLLAGHLHREVEGGRRQRGTLEQQVEHRTAELMRANRTLRAEIARRQKSEALQQRAKEEAEKANRAKSEFLSRMSHELRTPLNAILGFGQILQAQVPSDAHRDCTTHIVNAGRHLLGLINEVLDISRIEAGRVELAVEPVRMAETVGETLDLIRPLADEHGITIELSSKACVSEIALMDRQRFKQVLLNLLSNAVKFSPEGSRVTLGCRTVRGKRVRLYVRDNGPGIAPEKLERLFVPFDRLDADHTGVPGTGLGLTLSKHLTEAMGGALGMKSVVGKGSTFWVELPLEEPGRSMPSVRPLPAAVMAAGVANGGPGAPGNGYVYSNGNGHRYALRNDPGAASSAHGEARTLLYIEDNASNRSLVVHLLEDRPGTRLLTAARGEEGLELARAHRPDLILLDLHLPDLDGWEVLARLRRHPATRRIPVVAVSADANRDTIDRLLVAGARAYLTKPLNVDHFHHLLTSFHFAPLAICP